MLTIGEKIHLLRKRSGESQMELADAIQVSASAVCHWEIERQQPNAYAIREICKHYKVSADWLLGLEDKNEAD